MFKLTNLIHNKQTERQKAKTKTYDRVIRCRKVLWQTPTVLHYKSPGVVRDTRAIQWYNKDIL